MNPARALVPLRLHPSPQVSPAELGAAVRRYVTAGRATSTRRAYRSDWRAFEAWCATRNVEALPASPSAVALYATELAACGRKVATVERALAAVVAAHEAADLPSPRRSAAVRAVMAGIRRTHGVAPAQKAPILVEDLRRMLAVLPDTMKGARDRALLLVGFAGAFRRSELVALDVGDLLFGAEGLTVTIRRSKTDQEGEGRKLGIPMGSSPATCPVRALRSWLERAGITEGAVFLGMNRHGVTTGKRLSPADVARVVKAAAEAAGLDAARFSGHSLRAGLATAAAKAGKSERAIMGQTGHRSTAMVRRYIRDAELFNDNAACGIGL